MKNIKGITLTSLVITIILLLILMSIIAYSGNSTIRYARYNKAKSEFQLLQSYVNSWYDEYTKIEVLEEEIPEVLPEGMTREQKKAEIKESKQQQFIAQYGSAITDSSCDQTISAVSELRGETLNVSDYRFLSEEYLKNNFGLDESFDFLVNIPKRDLILFNGIIYENKTYYTASDFGVLNVKDVEINAITYNVSQGDNKEILIKDLKLNDKEAKDLDISNFIVQYIKIKD